MFVNDGCVVDNLGKEFIIMMKLINYLFKCVFVVVVFVVSGLFVVVGVYVELFDVIVKVVKFDDIVDIGK